jgi:sugar phosphate isomerase/epimerase
VCKRNKRRDEEDHAQKKRRRRKTKPMKTLEISVRDGNVPRHPGQNVFDALREVGISAIEMQVDRDFSTPTVSANAGREYSLRSADEIAALKAKLESEKVSVVALLLATDFSSDDAEENVDWAVQCIRAAKELGAPAVRIDTATRNGALSVHEVAESFSKRVLRVLAKTADTGITLGIENHGHTSNDARFLDEVFARVPDKRLGMTLDTGNFYWFGLPLSQLYATLEKYAPRARHTHMKSIAFPEELREGPREVGYRYGELCCALDEGDIDMKRVVGFLKAAHYNGTLCIEDESLGRYDVEAQFDIIRRDAKTLRDAAA